MQLKEIGNIIDAFKSSDFDGIVEKFKALSKWQQTVVLSSKDLSAKQKEALASSVSLAAGESAAEGATAGFGAAIDGLITSVSGFVATIAPVIPLILAAVVAFKRAYDAAHAYENAMESANTAKSNYESTISDLDSVNEELETTSSRIDELQSKGTLTLTEQAELEKLQAENAELDKRAALLENVAAMQQRAATNTAMDALNTVGSQSKYSKEHAAELDSAVGYTTELQAAKEDLKYLQQLYKTREDLQKRLESAASSGNQNLYDDLTKQLNDTDKEISDWATSLGEQVSQFEEYKNTLEQDTNLGEISGGQEMLSELTDFIDAFANVDKELTPAQEALSNIQSFFDGSTGKNAISDAILDMVEKGSSAEQAINKLGLSLEDLGLEGSQVEYLNQYFNDLADSANNAANAVEEIDSSLSGISTASESANAGDNFDDYISYIDNARRYYAQGKTGIDDFKTVAASLNNGSQDAADNLEQFSNNIEKISKYLTVDTESKLTQSSSTSNVDGNIKSSITLDDGQLTVTKQNMLDLADAFEVARKKAESTGTEFKSTADLAEALDVPIDFLEYALGKMQDYDISTAFDDLPKASQNLNDAKTELSALQELYNNMDAGSQKDALGEKIADWKTQISAAEDDLSTLDTDIVLQMKLEYDINSLQAQIDDAKTKATLSGDSTEWATSISYQMQLVSQLEENGITVPVELKAEAEDLMTQLQDAVASGNTDLARELYPKVSAAWQEVIDSMESSAGLNITTDADTSKAEEKIDKVKKQANDLDETNSVVKLDAEDNTSDALAGIIMQLTGFDKEQSISMVVDDKATPALVSILADMTQIPEDKLMELNAEDGISGVLQYIIDSYDELPEEMQTKLDATDDAIQAVDSTQEALDNMDDEKVISLTMGTNALDELGDTEKDIVVNYVKGLQEQPDDQNALMSYIISNQDSPENMSALVNYIKNNQDNPDAMSAMLSYIKKAQQSPDGKKAAVDYIKKNQGNPTDKSAKVNYVKGTQERPSVMSTIVNYITGGKKYNGTVHYNGTVNNNYIDSNAFGNWGIAKDETSLVNELGEEVIVRDGKPFTVNNGYPAITKLKRGDIIFNHKQTEELLRKGYVTGSHAEIVGSFAGGSLPKTAYASGTSEKTTIDWFETAIDRIERTLKKFTNTLDNTFKNLNERLSAVNSAISTTKTELSKQQTAYTGYMDKANSVKLSDSLKKQVREGAYYIYDYDEATQKAINSYKEWYEKALDAKDAIDELNKSLSELYKEAFDIVAQRYDNEFAALENRANMIDNSISLAEAQGYSPNAQSYRDLINLEQRKKDKYQSEYKDLTDKLNAAVASGTVQKFSDEWWDMYNQILEVAGAIQEADIAMAEYEQTIRELEWDNFDFLQDRISQITSESEFLINLLESSDLFDDNGKMTSAGWATVSLRGTNYATYMQQAKDYAEELQNIESQLADDPANKDLIERKEELLKLQQESIQAAQEEKQAVIDLVQEGIEKELDALQELIDKYTSALDSAKDLHDYQKKVADYNSEISSLQKQLDAYSGDTSEESRAKIQQIKTDLAEARKNLEETQYDQYISDQKKLLDNLYTEYETVLNERLDDTDALFQEMIDSAQANAEEISKTITETAQNVGYTMTDNMSNIVSGIDNVSDVLNQITEYFSALLDVAFALATDDNGDPIINSDGTTQDAPKELSGETRKKFTVQGYADGGIVGQLKAIARSNGDDAFTINTLKKGEAVLTPEQTRYFKEFTDNLPLLYNLPNTQGYLSRIIDGGITDESETNITNYFEINNSIDHVDSYDDLIAQMCDDPKFEKMVQAMGVDRAAGKSSLAKYKYRRN